MSRKQGLASVRYDHVRCHPGHCEYAPVAGSISCFRILEAIQIRKTNEHGRQGRTRGFGSEDARTAQILETGGEDLGGRSRCAVDEDGKGSIKGIGPGINLE